MKVAGRQTSKLKGDAHEASSLRLNQTALRAREKLRDVVDVGPDVSDQIRRSRCEVTLDLSNRLRERSSDPRDLSSSADGRKAAVVSDETQPTITLITMDRETSSIVFTRSDRKEARFPLGDSPFAETSALSRLHYTPSFDGLLATTRAGDDIVFELPKPSSSTDALWCT
jgi:hypothetical protein